MYKKLLFGSLVLFAGVQAKAQSTQNAGNSDMTVIQDQKQATPPLFGPEENRAANFSISPNPFTTKLTIQVPERAIGATWIMEAENGTMVRTGVFAATTTVVSTSELPAGTYFYRIEGHLGIPYRVDKID